MEAVFISSQSRNKYRANKRDFTSSHRLHSLSSRLAINQGQSSGETSHFGCSEIIMVNRELPLSEIECVENYLMDKYFGNRVDV